MLGFLFSTDKQVRDKLRGGSFRIRCPKCQWQPGRQDTWCCTPGCGHVWNTFDTRALCPGCSKQWTHTSCLRCTEWSLHEEWYDEQPAD
ncbi:MAG TPA: hypothetical protein VM364_07065 [Vicinamibacterales bacterium]|nr:hypothetical protein [Vicinamibacterales bacterium]